MLNLGPFFEAEGRVLGLQAGGVRAVGVWSEPCRRLWPSTVTACSRFPPAVGFYIFRGANNQKNTFRKNPSDPRVAGELSF